MQSFIIFLQYGQNSKILNAHSHTYLCLFIYGMFLTVLPPIRPLNVRPSGRGGGEWFNVIPVTVLAAAREDTVRCTDLACG